MKACTTEQAARAAKISRASLQEWIRLGKIAAPPVQLVKGKAVRLWNAADIKCLRTVKATIYRKGRGRKAKREGGGRRTRSENAALAASFSGEVSGGFNTTYMD